MPAGRPTKSTDELIQSAWDYVDGGWEAVGDKVPSVAGLACEIGVSRETCYAWAKENQNQFSDILNAIAKTQERELLNNGLIGKFNPPITKMMLSKHGYSDKVEQDLTSSDGSMKPQEVIVNITGVAPDADAS